MLEGDGHGSDLERSGYKQLVVYVHDNIILHVRPPKDEDLELCKNYEKSQI